MLDYLSKNGLESIEIQKVQSELFNIGKEINDKIAGLETDDVIRFLDDMTAEHVAWLSCKENFYDANYEESIFGTESAYVTNRSVLKNAFIRFKMMFKFDKERAVVEYAEVLKNVDPDGINRGMADLIMNRASIEAYDEIMHIANDLAGGVDRKEIEILLQRVGDEINSRLKKLIFSLLMAYVPVVQLGALAYIIYLSWSIPKEAEDLNNEYGEEIRELISRVISKTKVAKKLGLTMKNGKYDVADLTKFVTHLNKLRAIMIPMKHRRVIGIPDLFKSTTPVSHEDRVAMATMIKNNADLYLDTMGNSPSSRANAARFILSADQISQNMQYGETFGLASEETIYAGLAESFMVTFADLVTITMVLVRDLKKY